MLFRSSLVDILSNILDFSRLENIPAQLEQVEFDLDSLIEQTVDLFVGRAAEKGIEIVYASPGISLPKVFGDPLRLRQVLSNLIGNAVKFTLKGHVLVRLEASLQPGARRGQFQIHITDTGVGIRSENQEKIFGAFTQEDGSTTRRFGGSGLGLTIARQLMGLMGGQIRLESKVGEGSCFTVSIPMTLAAEIGRAHV